MSLSRLQIAIKIARQAGQIALKHFQNPSGFELKGDESPVTIADREVERFIRQELAHQFPNEPILGEEEGGATISETRWVIDPIDGTKSFLSGVPLFSVLIGFEQSGTPTVGVAEFPALGQTYWGELGAGAFCNDSPIRVSTESDPKRSIICLGSLEPLLQRAKAERIPHLVRESMAVRTWGDAFGHMMVARGDAQAMIDPRVSRWDVSAIIPILVESGALTTDLAGHDPLAQRGDTDLELISLAPAFAPMFWKIFS